MKKKNTNKKDIPVGDLLRRMEKLHVTSYLGSAYAKALMYPWKVGENQRVPSGSVPTSMTRKHFSFSETVSANTPVLWAFMPYYAPSGSGFVNIIKSGTLTDSGASNKVVVNAGNYGIGPTNYTQYRLVSASVSMSNVTALINRSGITYGANIVSVGHSNNSVAAGIAPISTGTTGAWPSQCAGTTAFSQVAGCVKNTNPNDTITVRWYPLDDDCVAFNESDTVEGGKAITVTGSSWNACNLCFIADPGAYDQIYSFQVSANYEYVSSSTCVTFGEDNIAIPAPASPLVIASHVHNVIKPMISSGPKC